MKLIAAFYERFTPLSFLKNNYEKNGELRSIWLGDGHFILMLERTQETSATKVERGAGIFLIAFNLENEAKLRQALSQSKISIESETQSTIYIRDPEGNRLAFSSYPHQLENH